MYIKSLLDTDLYKYTMMLFALEKHPNLKVEYAFKCRSNVDINYMIHHINYALDELCNIDLKDNEIQFLCDNVDSRFNRNEFKNFKLNRSSIVVSISRTHQLDIRVYGIWWQTILFEVFVLAIVNQIYSELSHHTKYDKALIDGRKILSEKINYLNEKAISLKIMEFGTRRRFSLEWQEYVLGRLVNETTNIVGTSNVGLAMKYNIPVLGSIAHEALQVGQGIYHPVHSQKRILEEWSIFWGDKYSIALTDIFPTAKFIKDFDIDLANKYKGLRHDSGDPLEWGYSMIDMYENYGIDPKTKTLVFSDGLNIYDSHELHCSFNNIIPVVFGIGTNLTNDMGIEHKALQVVMKIVKVNGLDVAKISNNPSKSMCENKNYLDWLTNAVYEECEK